MCSCYITSLILGILIPPKGCIPVAQAVVRHSSQLHHGSFTVLQQQKAALQPMQLATMENLPAMHKTGFQKARKVSTLDI